MTRALLLAHVSLIYTLLLSRYSQSWLRVVNKEDSLPCRYIRGLKWTVCLLGCVEVPLAKKRPRHQKLHAFYVVRRVSERSCAEAKLNPKPPSYRTVKGSRKLALLKKLRIAIFPLFAADVGPVYANLRVLPTIAQTGGVYWTAF